MPVPFPKYRPNLRDAIRFTAWATLFSAILFSTQFFRDSKTTPTFDSSSIENRESVVAIDELSFPEGEKEIFAIEDLEPKASAPPEALKKFPESILPLRKKATPSKISFSFRPDNVNVDERIVSLLRSNLTARTFRSKVTPLSVTVDSVRLEPRGQLSGQELIMSASIPSDSETLKVFVHELGHVVDIHYLKSSPGIDPSESFYSISWDSYKVKKKGAKLPDFVSGYALSNKYEDFAESFSFFVFHNDEFKKRSKTNAILAKKYRYFESEVFAANEFAGTDFATDKVKPYLWDTTKVAVDTKKYLFYLK